MVSIILIIVYHRCSGFGAGGQRRCPPLVPSPSYEAETEDGDAPTEAGMASAGQEGFHNGGGEGKRASAGRRIGAMLRRSTPNLHSLRSYGYVCLERVLSAVLVLVPCSLSLFLVLVPCSLSMSLFLVLVLVLVHVLVIVLILSRVLSVWIGLFVLYYR